MDTKRIETLALEFPELRNAPLTPWNAEALDVWACDPARGVGAFYAARFVLSVYNDNAPWKCGAFNVHEALTYWDWQHRAAFLRWVAEPWWA